MNRCLEYMFIMLNAARFGVGQQGIALSERAYQHALAYAQERVQGRAVEGSAGPVAIVRHPDVQRMLLTMRGLTEARSEEHTSELQSLMRTSYAVFCLKKKKQTIRRQNHTIK